MEGRGRGRGQARGQARNQPAQQPGQQQQQQGQQSRPQSGQQSRPQSAQQQGQQSRPQSGRSQSQQGQQQQQQQGQGQQGQGQQAPPQQAQKQQPPRQAQPNVSMRGGGGGVTAVTEGMGRMKVGDNRRDEGYTTILTRPQHVDNATKKGTAGNAIRVVTNYFRLVNQPDWILYQYHVYYNPDIEHKGARRAMLFEHSDLLGTTRTAGKPIKVVTNYFRLVNQPDWILYQYHVYYNPDIEHKGARRAMLFEHSDMLGATRAFDGMILYLPKKLEKTDTEVYSVDKKDGKKIQITIKKTKELPVNSPQSIQILNIIFRKMLECIELKLIGPRNFFDTKHTIPIPQHKLEIMPGYTTSILNYDGGVLLCADTSHKVLRSDTVLDIMYALHDKDRRSFHEECSKQLIGQIVMTRHNNKTYLVDDIAWDKRVTHTFNTRDAAITYEEYFSKQYGITIHDKEQPLLMSLPKARDVKVGRKEDIYLPPSLCVLTGLDEAARRNYTLMKDIGSHARQPPTPRVKTLNHLVSQMNSSPKAREELEKWKIKLAPTLSEVEGRVLPGEVVKQCGQEVQYNTLDAEWARGMKGKNLNLPVPLTHWIFVFPNRCKNNANTLLDQLKSVGSQMGFRIADPVIVELMNDRTDTYLSSIRAKVVPNETQLVMAMFMNVRKDRYEALKHLCCCEVPVPCQLVVSRTVEKNTRSVCTKIAIQLNCKLGGDIWNVDIPLKSLMVVGIDTFHKKGKKSVGATVASMNATCTRFYSKAVFHHESMELLDGLEVNITASLKQYNAINNTLPGWIVIYRDGVGDGQLGAVHQHEVPQITRTLKKVGGEQYNPNVFFIVVKKRINTRIMSFGNGQGQFNNPPPGTVVDTVITKPEWFDFFLVAQAARQGTVSPTHYNVIDATPGLKADHMQRLAYKLCHLYYNWPGTVRVPAPCQYAHKLAALVGDALHSEPHQSLCDKLFFL